MMLDFGFYTYNAMEHVCNEGIVGEEMQVVGAGNDRVPISTKPFHEK